MMGNRQKCNGQEFDMLYWKSVLCVFYNNAGISHDAKRRMSKKRRQEAKRALLEQITEAKEMERRGDYHKL